MTTAEAFVKLSHRRGIAHASGVFGSAFMPGSDPFGRADAISWNSAQAGDGVLTRRGCARSTGAIVSQELGEPLRRFAPRDDARRERAARGELTRRRGP
jgi:hypothetical protein